MGEFERLNSHVPHSFRVIALSLEDKIVFYPIGYVKTPNSGDEVKEKSVISQIILQPRLVEALDGIEGFSHLFVLFYLDKVPAEKNLLGLTVLSIFRLEIIWGIFLRSKVSNSKSRELRLGVMVEGGVRKC